MTNDSPTILLISLQNNIEAIGIRQLHHVLLKSAYDSHLLLWPDYIQGDTREQQQLMDFVKSMSPAIIGVSLMSCEYHDACDLTRAIKGSFPHVPVVWGGIHPTIAPEMCLEYADYVCIGEGENTIVDLARCAGNNTDFSEVNNICYKKEGQVVRNPLYPLIDDLDRLPAVEHVPMHSYVFHEKQIKGLDIPLFRKYARYRGTIYSLVSSRGCPFACTYCCNSFLSALYGTNRTRYRSIPTLIADLKKAINDYPFIDGINFQDDCFIAGAKDRISTFCEAYVKEIGKPFASRGIPIYLTEQKLAVLKEAGLSWLIVGLQSGSDRTCREVYNRRSLKEDFLRAAHIIKKLDIAPFYDVIMDNPYETDEDRLETIKTLIQTPKPYYPQFFSLTFYPGTKLTEKATQDGLIDPEKTLAKEYFIYCRSALNDLTRLATFLPRPAAEYLVALYQRSQNGLWFKICLVLSKIISAVSFEPLSSFRVILLSQRGNWLQAIKIAYSFLEVGLNRFRFQFLQQTKIHHEGRTSGSGDHTSSQ